MRNYMGRPEICVLILNFVEADQCEIAFKLSEMLKIIFIKTIFMTVLVFHLVSCSK